MYFGNWYLLSSVSLNELHLHFKIHRNIHNYGAGLWHKDVCVHSHYLSYTAHTPHDANIPYLQSFASGRDLRYLLVNLADKITVPLRQQPIL